MATGLVDSSVLVDVLRGYPAGVVWLSHQNTLGIPRATLLELVEGTSDKRGYRAVLKLVGQLEMIETTESDLIWATDMLSLYRHSHNVDSFDCMIAAAAVRLGLPIYTRNLKHFTVLAGDLVVAPY